MTMYPSSITLLKANTMKLYQRKNRIVVKNSRGLIRIYNEGDSAIMHFYRSGHYLWTSSLLWIRPHTDKRKLKNMARVTAKPLCDVKKKLYRVITIFTNGITTKVGYDLQDPWAPPPQDYANAAYSVKYTLIE